MDEICGICKYHEYEEVSQGWVCVNDQSEYLADWTDYGDTCDCWEEKDNGSMERH